MTDFQICSDDECVNVSLRDCNYVSSFLNVFIDSNTTPSPFQNIEDAKFFVEIIVKLLKAINDDIE